MEMCLSHIQRSYKEGYDIVIKVDEEGRFADCFVFSASWLECVWNVVFTSNAQIYVPIQFGKIGWNWRAVTLLDEVVIL